LLKADVIAIGAGPAGSTLASNIAKAGFDVFLIDKGDFPREKACGGALIRYENSSFRFDLDLSDEIIEKKVDGSLFHFPWGTKKVSSLCGVSFSRRVFDSYLAERAVMNGAAFISNTQAYDVTRSREELYVHLKNQRTREKQIAKTKLVAFCDGVSTLARKIGFGFERRPSNTAVSALYEMEWKDNPIDCFEFYLDSKISPWGYGWIFPKKDAINVGVFCLMSHMQHNIKEYLDTLVRKHHEASKKLRGKRIVRFSSALIPLAHAKSLHKQSALVIGDSAGMVDPIWGAGIKYAISGGKVAARVAVNCLQENDLSESRLAQYDKLWKRTEEYKALRRNYLFSKMAQTFWLPFDKNAFPKLISLIISAFDRNFRDSVAIFFYR